MLSYLYCYYLNVIRWVISENCRRKKMKEKLPVRRIHIFLKDKLKEKKKNSYGIERKNLLLLLLLCFCIRLEGEIPLKF